jgi:hypothetical protein
MRGRSISLSKAAVLLLKSLAAVVGSEELVLSGELYVMGGSR